MKGTAGEREKGKSREREREERGESESSISASNHPKIYEEGQNKPRETSWPPCKKLTKKNSNSNNNKVRHNNNNRQREEPTIFRHKTFCVITQRERGQRRRGAAGNAT